ncbi:MULTISPECIES: response regulator transcription factor [unclassified Fusibacter]|uniref:response regulator transcription factor n=1 Tax=unclassified Fusibacter TaxID=2624464 RepID=UPI0010111B5F|nr:MULTISPECIES: response regulator transcription factor [unclassified Fusibacter]MCK8060438.1 response regulator transcription factor [Fusibacter sp. A2]NPE20273.1 response regulator transcription factor [Fusibacter sp. A1]RXV63479.1 DNA-binding response regulator [Fusibacter sp. A1]
MKPINILTIEDDPDLRKIIVTYLKSEGYAYFEAEDGTAAGKLLDEHVFDVIILDVMLPDTDGWRILRNIRRSNKTPVIMLTSRSEEEDKLFGFELGADDYLTKPFSPRELMARIRALLARSGSLKGSDPILLGPIRFDPQKHVVSLDGRPLDLTPLEYDLMYAFIKNPGIALSREKLLDLVWGIDYFGDTRTVDTHIKRLRQKLEHASDLIETVRGYGYRLEVHP